MNEDELMSHQSFDLLIGDMDSVVYRACCACPEGSPDTHAFHNLKNIVDKMLDVVRPEAFVFYLSGDKNYRYDIATIRPYKGNRKQPKRTMLALSNRRNPRKKESSASSHQLTKTFFKCPAGISTM